MTARGLASDNGVSRNLAAGQLEPGVGERLGSAGLPYDLLRGFDRLARSPPLWPAAPAEWLGIVERARSFAFQWGAKAGTCEWPLLLLYGLHPQGPLARRDVMGAAFWFATSPRQRVLAITGAAIVLESPTGARQRLHRAPVSREAVLAWDLCGVADPAKLRR